MIYTTKYGDTWDKIAYDQYGSEYMLPILLEDNQAYRLIVIFDQGIELTIPDVDLEEDTSDDPPWMTEDVDELEDEVDGSDDENDNGDDDPS
jgi:phage tail protein X